MCLEEGNSLTEVKGDWRGNGKDSLVPRPPHPPGEGALGVLNEFSCHRLGQIDVGMNLQ